MLSRLKWLLAPLLAFALLAAAVHDADAGRLGGGKSFGSKPSYGSGYSKSVNPAPGPSQGLAGKPGAAPGMGSRFGGLGGMFGGLLMGGLIGSMLFGGGFGGPGILDLLLIGGGLFLLMKFLRARKAREYASQSAGYAGQGGAYAYSDAQARQDAHTGGGWGGSFADRPAREPAGPQVPEGFDADEFLAGAKAAYTRLQESWDKRDLEDIRRFTSDEVYAEIARQAQADPNPGRTEVLLVNARLLEARAHGAQTVATVYFDNLLREDPRAANPTQVREVWHFSRRESGAPSDWLLEGIQQLDI